MAFGFAAPIQHRIAPGAQSAVAAMQQSMAPDAPTAAVQVKPTLPPLVAVKPPSGQATMMPDTTLPPLVPPTVPQGTGLEDPSAAISSGVDNVASGFNPAGGEGMDIGEMLAEIFGG